MTEHTIKRLSTGWLLDSQHAFTNAADMAEWLDAKGGQADEPKANDDGWIEWRGGARPVDGDKMVEVKFRRGDVEFDIASCFSWPHYEADVDIVAYRLLRAAR